MSFNRRNTIKITAILMAAIFCFLLIKYMGLMDFIPQLRASAESPDGNFKVYVYQKRLFPRPIFPRMGATAKVYDKDGNLIFNEIIYHDDDWDDTVGEAYNKISFQGDEIHISPGVYAPKKSYVIKNSTLGKK